jgi:hypothetical protein
MAPVLAIVPPLADAHRRIQSADTGFAGPPSAHRRLALCEALTVSWLLRQDCERVKRTAIAKPGCL